MPYTKLDLQNLYNLSTDEVNQTLTAAGLTDEQEPYSDEEIQSGFDVIRSYFNSGQVSNYDMAAELFKQQPSAPQQPEVESQTKTKKKANTKKMKNLQENDVDQSECLNVLELIALASKQVGTGISLTEAVQILNICGLPDQEQYTSSEGDRFLEACDLVKCQSKSYEEVAAHFGVDSADDYIEDGIDEAAVALEQSGNGVISEVMRHKAKVDASVAASMYLKHLAMEFGSPEFQQEWHQMEQMLKAKVVGKSQLRARQMLGEIRMMPRSPLPLKASPEVSED